MKDYYVASCSFGKDSLAMILRLIEENKPLDEVVFYNTGMDFNAIYNIRNKIVLLLKEKGIKFTEIKPERPFVFDMFEKEVKEKNGGTHFGYGWCGGVCRWQTTFKIASIENYKKTINKNIVDYVGIAYDEKHRVKDKVYPLIEWQMTEKDCLKYCYERGYDWLEETPNGHIDLYKILDRVSCWCCANKNQWELYNIWKYLPQYWIRLRNYQSKLQRPFKKKYGIFELEERFINGYVPKHRIRKARS